MTRNKNTFGSLLLVGCIIFFLTVCTDSSNNKRKIWLFVDSSGRTKTKKTYYVDNSDTVIDGYVVHYYLNNKIKDSFEVHKNKTTGKYWLFDSLGNLQRISNFQNDKLHGTSQDFSKTRQLIKEYYYSYDKIIWTKEYFENGSIKQYLIFDTTNSSNSIIKVLYGVFYDSLGNKLEESGDSTEKL